MHPDLKKIEYCHNRRQSKTRHYVKVIIPVPLKRY
jgi:hypothetical protein